MPSNLETLELTVSSNSASAKEGIETLIGSLSSLSSAVEKSCSGLKQLNAELKTLKGFSGLKLPNIGKMTGADAVSRASRKKGNGYVEAFDMSKFPKAEEIKAANEAYAEQLKAKALPAEAFKAQLAVQKELFKAQTQQRIAANEAARAVKENAVAVKESAEATEVAATENTKTTSTLKALKEGFSKAGEGIGKFLGRVKRIATTMLIRSAIRALIKDIKEGVNNVYEWSKLNNGAFAKSLDTLKNKSGELKNSLGAAISPVLQAAIPLLNSLASAAINAFNWVNQLISLLTGKGSWTKATEGVHDYAAEVNKAGGAAQSWLATFDELNVMTSGGGGGGGGKNNVDYSDMFEEVTKFDDQIKEIADYLKANAESIKDMAIATGVAILGWKLSNAFAETLPALSKIAGLIGVGATIAITLQANWTLTNQYLRTGKEGWLIASALTTAIGTAGASYIASRIFHGNAAAWTAAFTLSLAAITDVIALVKNPNVDALSKESLLTSLKAAIEMGSAAGIALHFIGGLSGIALLGAAGGAALITFGVAVGLKLLTQKKDIDWGNIVLTETQIKDYVENKMFETNVNVKVEQFKAVLGTKADLEESVTTAIGDIDTQIDILSLGLDKEKTYENIKAIFGNEENGLIKDVKDLCNVNIDALKLTFASIDLLDGEGNAIDADVLAKGITGWQNVEIMMEEKGKELTRLLTQGAKGELTPEMEAYTRQLLEEVTSISAKIASAKEFGEATADFKEKALSAMSKGSFEGIISAFEEYSANYETTIRKALKENIASWYALADLTDDPTLKAEYMQIANDLQNGLETTVSEELKKQTSPGVQLIKDWLFGRHENGTVGLEWDTEELAKMINTVGITDMLYDVLSDAGFTPVEIQIMDKIKFSGWDFLKDEAKRQFIEAVEIDEAAIKELSQIGVNAMDLVTIVNWDKVKNMEQNDFVKAITSAYGASGIAAIKHRFPNIKASDILNITDWNAFSTSEQLNFLTALKEAFGAEAALKAAKDAGINIGKLVEQGMKSKDPEIKTQAESWGKIIKDGVESKQPVVKPKVSNPDIENTKNTITNGVSNIIAWVKSKAGWSSGYPNNLKTDIESQNPTVKAIVGLLNGAAAAVQSAIENQIKPTITANVTATGIDKIASAFKKALSAKVALITDTGKQVGSATIAVKGLASGGLVSGGDLFIANENGVPEMIGRFGNQAGVANQNQIVTGISRGVAEANAEQNALLRQQNALLRGILEKETNVRIGASAGLGRTVKQSLDMLNAATGG